MRGLTVALFLPRCVAAFDWGDFHKVAVIFFSFFGPLVILSGIALAAYFACVRSCYEKYRDDVHETHRSYHPWPPGSAKWQLQQFINSQRGVLPKVPPRAEAAPTKSSPTTVQSMPPQGYAGLLSTATPQYQVACLPSPHTTYTVALDPSNREQVPYTTVIKPKDLSQPLPVETIFAPEHPPKISYPPSISVSYPAGTAPTSEKVRAFGQPPLLQNAPISVITDSGYVQDREPIIRSPDGQNYLFSKGHDHSQLPQYGHNTFPRAASRLSSAQNFTSLSPRGLSNGYSVQSPRSSYQPVLASPNTQMQAIFVRTTTTTHRKTTLSPAARFTAV